jgi:uncharacterized protein (TIGR02271 family)
MSVSSQFDDISIGNEVFGSDGEKVGTVAEIYPGYITVEKGFFFPTDYFIPRAAVQNARDGQVFLAVSKDATLHSSWDRIPEDLETPGRMPGMIGAPTDELIGTRHAGTQEPRADMAATARDAEEIHIPVVEEELTATVRPTDAGAVRVEKRVVAEDRVLDVPVTEERLRVERRLVDRPVGAADQTPFEEVVVDVPLRQEAVDVQKQARVREDVVISKEAVEHTERVADTVRREEVAIEDDPRVEEVNP